MNVISISTDRKIFEQASPVRARQIQYGGLFDELHIVVFSSRFSHIPAREQIAPNVWVYSTRSLTKLQYIGDAVRIAQTVARERSLSKENTIVSVQDPFETGVVGIRLKKKLGMPLHVQIHTDFLNPYFKKGSIFQAFRVHTGRAVLAQADAVRVVSKRIAESLSKIKLQPGVEPQVLPIFVDIKKIEEATATIDLKKKYPQFNFIILMASRLTPEKNIPFAMDVFKKLHEEYKKIGLVIVGSGPEKHRLVAYARKLGISDSIVFEDWQNDLVSYYKTANMFLATSIFEGYGMTLVEAVASHCPTISSDVGIARDVLTSTNGTFVCPVGDTACFFNAISQLIENSGLRETISYEAASRLNLVVSANESEYLEQYKANVLAASRRVH